MCFIMVDFQNKYVLMQMMPFGLKLTVRPKGHGYMARSCLSSHL